MPIYVKLSERNFSKTLMAVSSLDLSLHQPVTIFPKHKMSLSLNFFQVLLNEQVILLTMMYKFIVDEVFAFLHILCHPS